MSYFSRPIHAAAIRESAAAPSDQWCSATSPKTPPSSAVGALAPIEKTGPQRVLIVEDEVIIAMNLESMIEDLGFEVCAIAARGAEAISLARTHRPEIVLMDVSLIGEMDGVEAARQIRDLIGAWIVFVTAYGSGEVLERIHFTVPDAPVVSKPVMDSALLGAINRTGSQ
jgi:CheY-like chemotaxis protein